MSKAPVIPLDLKALPPEARAAVAALIAKNTELANTAIVLASANATLEQQVDDLAERNGRLEHLVKELHQALYGKKSEKLPPDQRQLAFEDLLIAVAELQATGEDPGEVVEKTPRPKRPPVKRNHGRLPPEFERVTTVIEPDSIACPCGCGDMVRIGEDRSERLDIVPARFRVIETIRPKYACRTCQEGVRQGEPLCAIGSRTMASAPAHLIEGAMPTEAMIAHVLVSN